VHFNIECFVGGGGGGGDDNFDCMWRGSAWWQW
jgi:hypothetical protein